MKNLTQKISFLQNIKIWRSKVSNPQILKKTLNILRCFFEKKLRWAQLFFKKTNPFWAASVRPNFPENKIKAVQSVFTCILGPDRGCLHITNSSSICHFLRYNLASKHLIFCLVFSRKKKNGYFRSCDFVFFSNFFESPNFVLDILTQNFVRMFFGLIRIFWEIFREFLQLVSNI